MRGAFPLIGGPGVHLGAILACLCSLCLVLLGRTFSHLWLRVCFLGRYGRRAGGCRVCSWLGLLRGRVASIFVYSLIDSPLTGQT